eukprot:12493964-Alexandrium_andersonii.AAC.1
MRRWPRQVLQARADDPNRGHARRALFDRFPSAPDPQGPPDDVRRRLGRSGEALHHLGCAPLGRGG